MLSVYLLALIETEDPDESRQYLDVFFPVSDKFSGQFLASHPDSEVFEGAWAYPRTAIMKFPSEEDAKAWHDSAEYQQLARHRWASARSNLVMVRGPRD